jgi:predicted  nucleic acid-binding Zn-ribbon protein
MTTEATIPVNCKRCGGSGRYGPVQVQHGICFQCGGDGVLGYTAQAEVDRKAREAAKRAEAREAAKRAEARERAAARSRADLTDLESGKKEITDIVLSWIRFGNFESAAHARKCWTNSSSSTHPRSKQ